ncbi:hypothetical protein EKO23_23860 [Nocardioides guangzhouensis]|uniref:HIRAN domain-containing protein n=1 Tax=Nocardioides guangzhouensis TaxID=2497878 RepID=A0A4Q4Z2U2_9ACTN|nr:HIRAN domain-containing protein [Nocardioides guangzhouensis]RYP81226.1 hypothetical protein EKO23_23860 [Nocardioides guangzhouensis]
MGDAPMGIFDRLKGAGRSANSEQEQVRQTATAHLYTGEEDLEVVGESRYQEHLRSICGGDPANKVLQAVTAVLVPEPDNPYDSNAVCVQIEGAVVGYLPRDVAAQYLPGLSQLMTERHGYIALEGVVVGGGMIGSRTGNLGVWLRHDPHDFGVDSTASAQRRPGSDLAPMQPGAMRTGFSEAWLTDVEDDSYDLSWFNALPDQDEPAIEMLRGLLESDPDPIDRHFQFSELESRLYKARDRDPRALDEFDDVCRRHDAEMEVICEAFIAKWDKIPLLETYKQMAIRQQKAHNWEQVVWWAQRGIDLYGDRAARPEAVDDLAKRKARAETKIEAARQPAKTKPPAVAKSGAPLDVPLADPTPASASLAGSEGTSEIEILTCTSCGGSFERLRVRGRKPLLCPNCRG